MINGRLIVVMGVACQPCVPKTRIIEKAQASPFDPRLGLSAAHIVPGGLQPIRAVLTSSFPKTLTFRPPCRTTQDTSGTVPTGRRPAPAANARDPYNKFLKLPHFHRHSHIYMLACTCGRITSPSVMQEPSVTPASIAKHATVRNEPLRDDSGASGSSVAFATLGWLGSFGFGNQVLQYMYLVCLADR